MIPKRRSGGRCSATWTVRAFRDGNYKRTRGAASRVQNIIGLVTLLLIAVVLVYITKFYSLL